MPWYELESIDQLDLVAEASKERPQLIYKHSTRCHTCEDTMEDLNQKLEALEKEAGMLFLDLLKFRDVSNEIAKRFKVQHQSPQVLLISKGKAVFDADHRDIKADEILTRLKNLKKAGKSPQAD